MIKKNLLKRIIAISVVASLAICSTLMVSAATAPFGNDTITFDSFISSTTANAYTHFTERSSVQVTSTYMYKNITTGVIKSITTSSDLESPANNATVSFTAPSGCISYYISSTYTVSFSGQMITESSSTKYVK